MRMMARKPITLFEDELGELVDRYLLEGVSGNKIKAVLLYEAQNDYDARLTELKKEQAL